MLEERNRCQDDLTGMGDAGAGEVQVFRLKRLKERLGVVLGPCDDNPFSVGGTGREVASAMGNGRDTSKLDLAIIGIVFRLSENLNKEGGWDDGGFKLLRLRLRGTLLSLQGGACFDSSTAAELPRLLTSFRLLVRFVAKMSPTIPQYATSALSSWAEDSRKAVQIP